LLIGKTLMRNFLKQPSPSLFLILAAAALGSVELMPPTTPNARSAPAAASHGRSHSHECPICQLPLNGPDDEPSKFGPDPTAGADLIDALRR
jgi:hypothetical protein